MNFKLTTPAFLALPLLASVAHADVKMNALFSDNMVLQRDFAAPIFGEADAGEAVTVSIAGQDQKTVAGADGKWMVKLAPLQVAESLELTVSGKNTLLFKNGAVGEVWLASGQSNMEIKMRVADVANAQAEIDASTDPLLRQFSPVRIAAPNVQSDLKGNWDSASPATLNHYSAVAYFFARELRRKLKVPVGIIHSSWGGTGAQSWASREALEANPAFKTELLEVGDAQRAAYPQLLEKYNTQTLPAWQTAVAAAKAAGTPEPKRPTPPPGGPNDQLVPAALFNGMIAPLIPYGIKGVIWYQGESNNRNAKQYQTLFPTVIRDWRARWGQGDFPFLYVQLANYLEQQLEPSEGGWAELREAQFMALSLPNTGMASAIDIGESFNIHPKNKLDVGQRLSLVALSQVYGDKTEYSGPLYDSMSVEGNKIRLRFTHASGGLMTRDNAARFGDEPMPRTPPSSSFYVYFDILQQIGLLEGSPVVYNSEKVLTRNEAAQIYRFVAAKLREPLTADQVRPGTDLARLERTMAGLKVAFVPQLQTIPPGTLRGFAIAGADGKWVWGNAAIEGETVVVSSPEIAQPTAVRYSWANNPNGNLYNKAGLPASSFRTDLAQ